MIDYFRAGMRNSGWVEGQNFVLEARSADNQPDRYPALIADLVNLPVDVIVAAESTAAPLVAEATSTIPIVMVVGGDFVKAGFSCAINQPCRNITGLSLSVGALSSKRLELLLEVAPYVRHVGFLRNGKIQETQSEEAALRDDAAARGVEITSLVFESPSDLESILTTGLANGIDALLVMPDGVTVRNREAILRFTSQHRLPDGYGADNMARDGGLFSYGANREYNYERAAYYVDRLLRGAAPRDIPIERPTRFDLLLNLPRAASLGLTFPREMLLNARDVVQ